MKKRHYLKNIIATLLVMISLVFLHVTWANKQKPSVPYFITLTIIAIYLIAYVKVYEKHRELFKESEPIFWIPLLKEAASGEVCGKVFK